MRSLGKAGFSLRRREGIFAFFESAASPHFSVTASRATGSIKRIMAGEYLTANLGGSGRTDVIGSKTFGETLIPTVIDALLFSRT
jgi:hypothetical protein